MITINKNLLKLVLIFGANFISATAKVRLSSVSSELKGVYSAECAHVSALIRSKGGIDGLIAELKEVNKFDPRQVKYLFLHDEKLLTAIDPEIFQEKTEVMLTVVLEKITLLPMKEMTKKMTASFLAAAYDPNDIKEIPDLGCVVFQDGHNLNPDEGYSLEDPKIKSAKLRALFIDLPGCMSVSHTTSALDDIFPNTLAIPSNGITQMRKEQQIELKRRLENGFDIGLIETMEDGTLRLREMGK